MAKQETSRASKYTTSPSSASTINSRTQDDLILISSLIGEINNEYLCFECRKIMIDASQADDCGCRYCSECLQRM